MSKLKMKEEHQKELLERLNKVLELTGLSFLEVAENYKAQNSDGDYKMRARWALFHAADKPSENFPLTRGLGLYDYLYDSHIDSALKHVTGIK